ncbi:MAG: hypothetical protein ACRC2N_02200 [Aeromonas sp.]
MEEIKDQIQTLEEPELIAVPAPSFWLSQANAEFGGNQWGSNILAKAGIPAPQWLSNLAGRSSWSNVMTIGADVGFGMADYGFMNDPNGMWAVGNITPRTTPHGRRIRDVLVSNYAVVNGNLTWGTFLTFSSLDSTPNYVEVTIEGLGTFEINGMRYVPADSSVSAHYRGEVAVSQGVFDWFVARTGQNVNVRIGNV